MALHDYTSEKNSRPNHSLTATNPGRNLIPRHHQNTSQAISFIYKKILIQPNRGSCRQARLNHILGPVACIDFVYMRIRYIIFFLNTVLKFSRKNVKFLLKNYKNKLGLVQMHHGHYPKAGPACRNIKIGPNIFGSHFEQ